MTLEETVISIVQNNLEKKYDISLDTSLIEDLGIDSFDKLMIINALEDEFSVTIDEEDFKDITKISDIVNKLREKYPEVERV